MKNNIWFTSDWHANHSKIITLANRPFKNCFEMEQKLIENYNKVVHKNDLVFLQGDMNFGSRKRFDKMIDQMNGKKHFIMGNHKDYAYKEGTMEKFVWVRNYYDLWVQDPDAKGGKQLICIFHYPIEQWRNKHYNSIHVCGHSHGRLPLRKGMERRIDVSVEAWNYYPVSYEQIKEEIKKRELSNI